MIFKDIYPVLHFTRIEVNIYRDFNDITQVFSGDPGHMTADTYLDLENYEIRNISGDIDNGVPVLVIVLNGEERK
jgi:hypothetical protein